MVAGRDAVADCGTVTGNGATAGSGTTVGSGAVLVVSSGGVASGTVNSGGFDSVHTRAMRRTDSGVSLNTVRTHVRGVLEKTGCNRQVEVVALLTAISSTRPPSAV